MFFLYLLIILLVIELITLIHESGHFLVAKKNGVRVAEFSIGFGPAAYQKKVGTTTYSFRWLPFGGYVSVLSDSVVQEIEKLKGKNISPFDKQIIEKKTGGLTIDEDYSKQKSIDEIKTSRKILFATAGVLFNFVSIFVILLFSYAFIGKGMSTDQIFLKFSDTDTFYLMNSIEQEGNENFTPVSGYDEMVEFFQNPSDDKYGIEYTDRTDADGNDIGDPDSDYAILTIDIDMYDFDSDTFLYDREILFITFNGNYSDLIANPNNNQKPIPIFGNENQGYLILPTGTTGQFGITTFQNNFSLYTEYQEMTTLTGYQLLRYSFIDTFKLFWASILWLVNFISLGFVHVGYHPTTSFMAQTMFLPALMIFAIRMTVLFSALMITFNMLPVPPLDGWRAFEYGYEGSTKKKISRKTTSTATKVGWGIIVGLFILGIII